MQKSGFFILQMEWDLVLTCCRESYKDTDYLMRYKGRGGKQGDKLYN